MARRRGINKRYSQKVFTRGAQRTHKKNALRSYLMRGGIRL